MLRTLAKTCVANGLNWTGADKYLGSRRGVNSDPLVVCYHRVVKNYEKSSSHSINAQLVSIKTFEKQLDWIGERYDFVSLDELASLYAEGVYEKGAYDKGANAKPVIANSARPIRSKNNRPVAAITFDDGYADVYENAVPILSRREIPSAVFVVTDTIGTSCLQMHDELYLRSERLSAEAEQGGLRTPTELVKQLELSPEREQQLSQLLKNVHDPFHITRLYIENLSQAEITVALQFLRCWTELSDAALRGLGSMTWEMLKSMSGKGVTVGSHTKSHPLLAGESADTVRQQVAESRRILEEKLGTPIRHFAYPDGSFDIAAARAVAEANYLCGYTTCIHTDRSYPLMTIPRRVFWENTCTDSFGQFSPAILSCQVNGIFDPASRCQQQHGQM